MECVNPNLRMLSCSGVRLWDDRLVTVSSDVKGIDLLRVRFLSFLWCVLTKSAVALVTLVDIYNLGSICLAFAYQLSLNTKYHLHYVQ